MKSLDTILTKHLTGLGLYWQKYLPCTAICPLAVLT